AGTGAARSAAARDLPQAQLERKEARNDTGRQQQPRAQLETVGEAHPQRQRVAAAQLRLACEERRVPPAQSGVLPAQVALGAAVAAGDAVLAVMEHDAWHEHATTILLREPEQQIPILVRRAFGHTADSVQCVAPVEGGDCPAIGVEEDPRVPGGLARDEVDIAEEMDPAEGKIG